jgi:hypothetical protein
MLHVPGLLIGAFVPICEGDEKPLGFGGGESERLLLQVECRMFRAENLKLNLR